MPIERISVRGFRNLTEVELQFAPGANYLFGPNGAGKTNILEAIHYAAIGRSFRRCPERELVGFGLECVSVAAADSSGRTGEVRYDGREKRALRDGAAVERLSNYLGWVPVVVFLLDDIELVRGAPAMRRGLLDLAIAKADPGYIPVLGRYRQALRQHNRLLEQRAALAVRSAWEEELANAGAQVCEQRLKKTVVLLETAAGYGRTLLDKECSFEYRPSISGDGDLAALFQARLAVTRARSEELGQTLVGPHRDDIIARSAGRELRRFGSVGEQRLAAVALRLAEADLLLASRPDKPVFLVDEVVSELDDQRSRIVLELLTRRGQMVYAAARRFLLTDDEQCASRDGASASDRSPLGSTGYFLGKVFHVEAGKVSEVHQP